MAAVRKHRRSPFFTHTNFLRCSYKAHPLSIKEVIRLVYSSCFTFVMVEFFYKIIHISLAGEGSDN